MRMLHLGAALAIGVVAAAAETPDQMLRDWTALNGACRGGSGDDPRARVACEQRDTLDRRLTAAGWCYGRPGDLGSQREWQRCAAAAPARTETPQGPVRRALLDAARGPAEAARKQPVQFVVHALHRAGDWAFLFARMQRPDGRPLARGPDADDLTGDGYAALLRREGSGWRIVEVAVGPTDVAWEGWGRRHGVPASVFAMP